MAFLINEAAASSSSSSLPLSSTDHQNHYTYEVFLSFRGEDTCFNFTDHLYNALCRKGIETFRDADKLRRGEDVSQELLKAIEESRVSIVVFSQNYASSTWCLNELVKILECRKSKRQDVRPVFYKVAPSDVRHQRGAFGDAFATLGCRYEDSMDKWKTALKEAADLSGWPLKDGEYETKFIEDIVEELSAQVINPSCYLDVAEHPIGLASCRQDVIRLLHAEENIVHMVGIWGPGGIGKTTIAKYVFNSICHKFQSSCFLADVRSNGLAQLQETLLSNFLDSTLKVSSVDQGVNFIKTWMRHKKVLLILDDVSDSSQLQKLVPFRDCFGPGSRILITTRDKNCLTAHQVDEIYEVKMLDDDQALKLFSLNAFRENGPPSDHLELARCAVHYAQGLPLTLIVLGSHLFGRSREEWKATLDSCKGEDPYSEIRNILKISYDALGVDLQGYFLDIACFFKGKLVHDVKPILEACYDLKSVNGIAQLQEKALIRIANEALMGGWIWMHDLIEEMGKDIVYKESPNEPGKRNRVWSEEDVDDVLTNNTGTKKVVGIQVPWGLSTISLNAKTFSKMKNLRYISMKRMMKYESFYGDIDYLSNQLRWLDWPHCPLQCFPSNFHAKKLVNLDISWSRGITRLWEGQKNFSRLTCMNLEGCESLTELPALSGIPNLEELNLSGCRSLTELPDLSGIPNLKGLNLDSCTSLKELPDLSRIPNLKKLDLFGCTNLVEVPDSIRFLHNLETLHASGCSKLATFPKIPVKMDSLRRLSLEGSDIRELDESIENLIGLEELHFTDCKNLTTLPCSICGLHNLKTLYVRGCSKLATFLKIPVKMDSLRLLTLKGSDIRELDESIENLIGLEYLDLADCKNLRTLPCSIYGLQNLWFLDLGECSKLVRFPTNTKILNVDGCSLSLPKLGVFSIAGCSSLSDCDFLMTLDCWETLQWLNLSRNNFVSLPACLTKFVKLRDLDLRDCKRLRGIPELPPNRLLRIRGCESLEHRFSSLTNRGAVIEPTPSSWLSLSSETPKQHRTTEEPSPTPVNPPKRQLTAAEGQASMVHSSHEMAISQIPFLRSSPIPMIPDSGWRYWHSWLSSANDDYHHQQE
ncbi:disease resistance protein RPV1-like [Rosa chinensis]|uniref:disease resistance protein RPV1-like n=1 Tax=Rosa chinensis TaxID=74649 RepID=UPI000D08F714|nr:disease resistance protein RPV1-like [Rosa chinensis]XP_040374517.1 disease resistance protein RPV1-like [Rosa chinensis]XP_040374518.1 disease resistance protein RPV1-like [Rosa chinensis]XP_040374519.1 disease resistance protein RPV1-like [Rosa chinensis]